MVHNVENKYNLNEHLQVKLPATNPATHSSTLQGHTSSHQALPLPVCNSSLEQEEYNDQACKTHVICKETNVSSLNSNQKSQKPSPKVGIPDKSHKRTRSVGSINQQSEDSKVARKNRHRDKSATLQISLTKCKLADVELNSSYTSSQAHQTAVHDNNVAESSTVPAGLKDGHTLEEFEKSNGVIGVTPHPSHSLTEDLHNTPRERNNPVRRCRGASLSGRKGDYAILAFLSPILKSSQGKTK
jgi:hypothetical protein